MKTLLTATVMAVLACASASAQRLNLDLSAVAAKATTKNEVTLEGTALQMIRQAASANKEDKGKAGDLAKIFSGVDGVAVRNYEFAKEGEYSDRDLEPLRQQVGNGSGWSRIVNVKEPNESTEIYVFSQGDKPSGMLIINAEPKELNVVHISGTVQLAQLQDIVKSTIHYDLANADPAQK
jgi:hypothetical protein